MHDPWWMVVGGAALGALAGAVGGLLLRRWWDGLGGSQARDAARRWWRSGLAAPPATIQIRDERGALVPMRPVRSSGLHLVVEPVGGGQRTWMTVGAWQAADREEFWRVWRYYGGQSSGWVDDDGDQVQIG